MSRLPSLFVSHGAPTFALNPGTAGQALHDMAARLLQAYGTPRAIVVVSAHWETPEATVGASGQPATIHDFGGFPEALYALRYPAAGAPDVAAELVACLNAAGLPAAIDRQRGLDHGVWVPLMHMFPQADIPVIPLSLPSHGGPQQALALGRALAPLAERGILIVGSGSITHNLGDYRRAWQQGGQTPAYVGEFADWLAARLAENDIANLLDYRHASPHGRHAHPSEEHLLPLFVALGAGGANCQPERFHAGVDDLVIAMDAYAFSVG